MCVLVCMYVYGHIHVCICVQFDLRGHNYIPILFGYLYPNTYSNGSNKSNKAAGFTVG